MDEATMSMFGMTPADFNGESSEGTSESTGIDGDTTAEQEGTTPDVSEEVQDATAEPDQTSAEEVEIPPDDQTEASPKRDPKEISLENTIVGLKSHMERLDRRLEQAEQLNRKLLDRLASSEGEELDDSDYAGVEGTITQEHANLLQQMKLTASSIPQYGNLTEVVNPQSYENLVNDLTREAMAKSGRNDVGAHRDAVERYLWTALPQQGKNPFVVLYEMLKPAGSTQKQEKSKESPAKGADKKPPVRGIAGVGNSAKMAGGPTAGVDRLTNMTPQEMLELGPEELGKLAKGV